MSISNAAGSISFPTTGTISTGSTGSFTPLDFFSEGANGLWYDNDPDSWFEDTSFTTPATFGNPIGGWLDKSGNGMNAIQSVAGSRLTYGRMPYGGVRNRLTYTEDLTNAVWIKTRTTAPDASTAIEEASSGSHFVQCSAFAYTSGSEITASITLEKGILATAPNIMQLTFSGAGFGSVQIANVNVLTGVVEATAGGATCTSEADPAGGWRFSYKFTATTDGTGAFIVAFCNNNAAASRVPSYLGAVTSDCSIYRAQVERSSTATAYQKVVAGWDVTEVGVASVPCPWLDGIDDFLDFTSTGGAGLARDVGRFIVTGTSNITSAISTFRAIARLSTAGANTDPRAFLGGTATGNLSAQGRRLDANTTETVSVSQNTFTNFVATADFNYMEAELYLRRGGAVVASDLTFQTTGNTEDTDSFACYIGRNVTNYYGGFIPSVFAIADTNLSDAQLLQLETYMANQIGGTGI